MHALLLLGCKFVGEESVARFVGPGFSLAEKRFNGEIGFSR